MDSLFLYHRMQRGCQWQDFCMVRPAGAPQYSFGGEIIPNHIFQERKKDCKIASGRIIMLGCKIILD